MTSLTVNRGIGQMLLLGLADPCFKGTAIESLVSVASRFEPSRWQLFLSRID
jgi:hypothetical protein